MTSCEHKNRGYDLFNDYEFTVDTAKIVVPNWCQDCECQDDEASDYKETTLYYKRKGLTIEPDCDWEYNSFPKYGFEDLWYQNSNQYYLKDLDADLEVEFEAHINRVPYEEVKLYITYQRCSEEEYNKINNKK